MTPHSSAPTSARARFELIGLHEFIHPRSSGAQRVPGDSRNVATAVATSPMNINGVRTDGIPPSVVKALLKPHDVSQVTQLITQPRVFGDSPDRTRRQDCSTPRNMNYLVPYRSTAELPAAGSDAIPVPAHGGSPTMHRSPARRARMAVDRTFSRCSPRSHDSGGAACLGGSCYRTCTGCVSPSVTVSTRPPATRVLRRVAPGSRRRSS